VHPGPLQPRSPTSLAPDRGTTERHFAQPATKSADREANPNRNRNRNPNLTVTVTLTLTVT